ncbi:MAG TPA: [protein-PII] uridylyltransferase [Micromonosporaceae bacterium]|nr:[protein-PII] uridylyltransferase [Micromonosporaceae bacterium]
MSVAAAQVGAVAREERAAALDAWLVGLFRAAIDAADGSLVRDSGVALVATGGLGRRECAPHGDIDLLLVHTGAPVAEIADRIWYPIWDAGVSLDHAVRTLPEALSVAIDDVRVALALLDIRHIAGDAHLSEQLRTAAYDQWRRTAGRALVRLRTAVDDRSARHGDLAFLLEGDVKESRGGLRDVHVVRAISALGITDAYRPPVRAAHRRLLDVRDALHLAAGRRLDRIRAQERSAVSVLVGAGAGDALLRRVSTDARTIAYALDDAWRAVERWRSAPTRSRRPLRTPIARDVVTCDGEVVLARTAVGPRPDPGLSIRVAAAAATSGLPIARGTLDWLARFTTEPMPAPWPSDARRAFATLLGSGASLLPVWEACDRYGIVGRWLPEWNRLRGLPQHHPIHVFTVDRHLTETVIAACSYVRDVSRPDLLLVGALLHDIGKGLGSEHLGSDHAELGASIASDIAARMGFPAADVATVTTLVRHHLLLPTIATRRDISDPVTVATVADAVRDSGTLELLHALALADAEAAGPAATSAWRTRLVGDLVRNVGRLLTDGEFPAESVAYREMPTGPLPAVDITDDAVTVAAIDRRGLLAAVAGVLALHRLDVIGADTWTAGDRAVVRVTVAPRFGAAPDRTRLGLDLRLAATGEMSADRFARLATSRATRATRTEPVVSWHADATDASVVELRAADAPGLLYRVTQALQRCDVDVRAARVATLGGDVVDAFYLAGSWPDPTVRAQVTAAVLAAAS